MSGMTFAAAALTALLAVSPVVAQTLKATIPFDFRIGNTAMEAGEYTVTFDIPGVVRIVRDDRNAAFIAISTAVQARKTPETGSLVFNKYGETHFLSQVWRPGYDHGRQLTKSKVELEVASTAGPAYRASVLAQPVAQASKRPTADYSGSR